ncbi:MAG: ribosome maturation factor RimM [Alphaproteobacteria bacterium]
MKKKILVGQFLKPHGLKGGIKLRSFMQVSDDIFSQTIFDEAGKSYQFETYGSPPAKGTFFVTVNDGITRNEAEDLQGTKLFIQQETLKKPEKDEFFYDDLIGLNVFSNDTQIGTISHVLNFGAGDILEIKFSTGEKKLISFEDSAVFNINLKEKRLEINEKHLL